MPVAAVPAYLGDDFSSASPGMRFGMYLMVWGIDRQTRDLLWGTHDIDYEVRGQDRQERPVKHENKVSALAAAKRLNDGDQRTMKALLARQKQVFDAVPGDRSLRLDALAIAPFTTGLGNEHPLENGFAFLNPYGLPYLPGSGVKGVLRQAARELASGEWGDAQGWSDDKRYALMQGKDDRRRVVLDQNRQPVMLSPLDVLFGRETVGGDSDHVRGALVFWDVIPQIKGDSLAVDIMTPHQGHYYQKKSDRKSGDSTAPHESGQPNPISFLTVPPGSGFAFHLQCDLEHLARLAPELAVDGRWKSLVTAAFEHAFQWLGFGAKTAVGYGALTRDKAASARYETEAAARARKTATLAKSPNLQKVDAFIEVAERRAAELRGRKEGVGDAFMAEVRKLVKDAREGEGWDVSEKRAVAEAVEAWAPRIVNVDMKDQRKKLKLNALKGEA